MGIDSVGANQYETSNRLSIKSRTTKNVLSVGFMLYKVSVEKKCPFPGTEKGLTTVTNTYFTA